MKNIHRGKRFTTTAVFVLACSAINAQDLPTTGSIETRSGKLALENGYPSAAPVEKVFDDIDYQRACQAYLWALPLMAMQQWQNEHLTKFQAGKCDYVDYLTFQDKLGLLTANATTPYIMAFPNLRETGPLVFEIPTGPTAGGFTDFWQRPITDSGQTGPDKGAGGKYLILGPDDPDIKPEGYYVFRSPTVNIWSAHRALDPDPTKARALIDGLKIYPYSQRENPTPTRHVSPNGRKWSGTQPRGLAYWEGLAKIISEEPVHERDRIMMGMLQPLGIEKGKPFAPTARQKQILEEAARTGELMARTIAYEKRFDGTTVWTGKNWDISLFLKDTNQEAEHHTQLDERSSWFYEAVGVSTGMMGRTVGFGQLYLETAKDSDGNWLDGSKSGLSQSMTTKPVVLSIPVCNQIDLHGMISLKMPMALLISTSALPLLAENQKVIGSRPFQVKVGFPTSDFMAQLKPTLIALGFCQISSKSNNLESVVSLLLRGIGQPR